MFRHWLDLATKTRSRTLIFAGIFAVVAILGPYYRIWLLSVVMCLASFQFIYYGFVKFERPFKGFQKVIIAVEFLILIPYCFLLVRATVLYLAQFVK